MSYRLISGIDCKTFNKRCDEFEKQGYQPFGVVYKEKKGGYYFQQWFRNDKEEIDKIIEQTNMISIAEKSYLEGFKKGMINSDNSIMNTDMQIAKREFENFYNNNFKQK